MYGMALTMNQSSTMGIRSHPRSSLRMLWKLLTNMLLRLQRKLFLFMLCLLASFSVQYQYVTHHIKPNKLFPKAKPAGIQKCPHLLSFKMTPYSLKSDKELWCSVKRKIQILYIFLYNLLSAVGAISKWSQPTAGRFRYDESHMIINSIYRDL